MSPSAVTSLIVTSIVITIGGIFIAGAAASPICVAISALIVIWTDCLSPGLGCNRITFRGSAPALRSLTVCPELEAAVLGAVCVERVSLLVGMFGAAPGVSPVIAEIFSTITLARNATIFGFHSG